MDWNDLKVLLALARQGSARAAAKYLGVSNSTVTRRLDELENALQTRLFDRTPDGYRLTGAGEALLPMAEHVEELVAGAERRVTGEDQHLEGTIRITMPDVGGMGFMMQRLADFAQQYPGIELEFLPSFDTLDLSRREADIAIRGLPVGVRPPEQLVGRYLGAVTASTYVHRDLLKADAPEDLSHLTWIGKRLEDHRREWLQHTRFPDLPVRHAVEDVATLAQAVHARMGVAYMPCYALHEMRDVVVRVPGSRIVHSLDMWVLTHRDLRLSARMRVLREIIADEFDRIRPTMDSRERGSGNDIA
ncbi:MAG: LysR family transcriptional regulator [Pseudomonadota bacterium]